MTVDTRSLSRNEQGVLASAAVAAVLSFIPGFIRVTFEGPGQDMATTAWTSFATVGMVLLLVAAALVGIAALSDDTLPQAVPWRLVALVAAVLGTLLIVLEALSAGSSAPGASVGPGWSGWLLIVTSMVLTYFAVETFRESGDEIDLSEPED